MANKDLNIVKLKNGKIKLTLYANNINDLKENIINLFISCSISSIVLSYFKNGKEKETQN